MHRTDPARRSAGLRWRSSPWWGLRPAGTPPRSWSRPTSLRLRPFGGWEPAVEGIRLPRERPDVDLLMVASRLRPAPRPRSASGSTAAC
ncbi:hypothetical protein HBB16_11100 [Pseudonocardia sp. MCCB 268]|nr:hypothetical protein [Pseudonocardia cytotoxica]